ncbi:calmodulin-like protein 3 [Gastrolobium bilobum]|uniref:calmodulin-like protein 3 n=1 Tax=Gastrolobium bilobum TaxID=150636 RepID=UPI002AB14172|nr:calmodulin-like protein 3 [Gastrolobium bilobum]
MVLTALFLAVLFIAGLINVFYYIPTNKIRLWLQIFFPNNACKTNFAVASSSSQMTKVERDGYRKDDLKKVFSTFDKNDDGFITRHELRESLRNIRIFMTDREIDDIVVKFDSNGDGLIDFDEFCLLTSESMGGNEEEEKEGIGKEGEEVNLKEAFDVFDKDKDGLISVEELALVLTSLGLREGKKVEECKEMIRKVDMDGDGMVNFNEFKTMMINGGKLVFVA